jgi:UDP-N-acetylmuramate--alanine ligase
MHSPKHLYLIGAGGAGMLWIADYALAHGWTLSGTDLVESTGYKRLVAAGANLTTGTNPADLPDNITEAVITAAITPSAPHWEVYQELCRRGIPVVKRSEWVGALTKQYTTIAVAGTHGKTTTSALIGWILERAGYDPVVFTGGNVAAWGSTRIGKGEYLVLEADEYDRSFHRFFPQIAVLLNIEADHHDYYTGGLPEIMQSFRRFLRNLPSGVHAHPRGKGILVAYGRDQRVRKVAKGFKFRMRWYDEQHRYAGVQPPQPGRHMKLNATAAAKVAHELGVPHVIIKEAIASFPGVGRRFERLGTWNGAELYDDYAHHPTEVAALLQSIQERWPVQSKKRVAVVFQPHQLQRTQELFQEFATCFTQHAPHTLILAPIFFVPGREQAGSMTIAVLGEAVAAHLPSSTTLVVANDQDVLEKAVRTAAEEHDVVFVVGAGSIRSLVDTWRA